MEKKLADISLHLLDLGKRNRLLNYKESTFRTITIINSDLEKVFEKITNSTTLSIYPLDTVLQKYKEATKSTADSIDNYSISQILELFGPLLKANELLCYKKEAPVSKVFKTIYKEYQESLAERGINTLYMTFGLVEYPYKKDVYNAPLLLIPLVSKVVNGKYTFHEAEDEIILNPTLAYLLKTEYKVSLEEYSEKETTFIDYFSKVSGILKEYGMTLKVHASIGIYSFLKMNMFNDLTNHKDIVLQNKNIRALLGVPYEQIPEEGNSIYPVVNADSSQTEAIEYASKGISYVLQGPPGSGKSQTITNIIATMIGNGKKVLFVSEKQAALNVVYENLRRAGLETFALELHSHKANKKEVIEELYKTAILPHYDIQNDAFNAEKKFTVIYEKLEDYRQTIHHKIDRLQMTLYEVYSDYLDLPSVVLTLPIKNIEQKDGLYLEQILTLLQQYQESAVALGYDYHEGPFYGFSTQDVQYIRFEAQKDLNDLELFYQDQLKIRDALNEKLPLRLKSYQDLVNQTDLLSTIVSFNYFMPEYFIKRQRTSLLDHLEDYLKASQYLEKSTLDQFLDLNILAIELSVLTYQFESASKKKLKWLSPTYHRLKKQFKPYMKMKIKDKDLVLKLKEAMEYQKFKVQKEDSLALLPKGYRHYEYELIYRDLLSIQKIPFDLQLTETTYLELKDFLLSILSQLKKNNDFKLNHYIPNFDSTIINLVDDDINMIYHKIKGMNDSIDLLPIHAQRIEILTKLNDLGGLEYLDLALSQKISLEELGNQYKALFLQTNIYYEVDHDPILKEFSGLGVDQILEEFKKLDQLHLETNKAIIVSKLSKQRPDDSILSGSKFAILIKEYNKTRKQKPIRVLLEEIFDLVLDIKPVFLMSPLSVSTYLNSQLDLFDVVIFDEASQVFAWDALGAIYRAKQCIIIGDSKQMPPSSFFTATLTDDEESEENDLESILDKGSEAFPTKRLMWHYRSRSEELIAFSNKAFYDSNLITIPQAKKHTKGFGIDFIKVENGVYEVKSRTNLIEAQRVVELVFEHFDTKSEESLGVVAFSNTQAELISDLIMDHLSHNPKYQKYFSDEVKEPFFVKNLETVQGDERDTIIFSICYGYNKDNKFYQRFGPLNNIGGERRLNVAVTRAKYNICVVSSIEAKDIRLEHTESFGVKLLKDYLDYAAHASEPPLAENEKKDGVVNDVVDFLTNKGFMVQKFVGTSSFRIDIAVQHPLTAEYMVAIMLDGASYQIGSCSDVNYLQELLLNRLGWKYYRIFSTLWINQQPQQQEKLLAFLDNVFLNKEKPIEEAPAVSYLVEADDDFDSSFIPYPMVTEDKIKELYQNKTPSQIIQYIVEKEEPIHKEYLLKRICFMYGRTKVTNIVRELFEKDLSKLSIRTEDDFLSVHPIVELSLRTNSDRSIEYIHHKELEDAIYKVVKKSNGITKEGCFKTIAQLLGYQRMSENANEILDNALVFLKLDGKVIEKEGCLYT